MGQREKVSAKTVGSGHGELGAHHSTVRDNDFQLSAHEEFDLPVNC